jgi:hypothetical protein
MTDAPAAASSGSDDDASNDEALGTPKVKVAYYLTATPPMRGVQRPAPTEVKPGKRWFGHLKP